MIANMMLKMVEEARLAEIEREENRRANLLSASMLTLTLPVIRRGVRGLEFDKPGTVFIRTKLTDALLSVWFCDAIEYHEAENRFSFLIKGATIGFFEPHDRNFVIRF